MAALMGMGSGMSGIAYPSDGESVPPSDDSSEVGLAIGLTVAGSLLVALAVGVPLVASGYAEAQLPLYFGLGAGGVGLVPLVIGEVRRRSKS
jgi:hypothetical protein